MPKKKFLYRQVYESIKKYIIDGKIPQGSKLPTEEEFTNEYKVSTITIKKALELLATEGYVHRVPGRGTFVSSAFDNADNTDDLIKDNQWDSQSLIENDSDNSDYDEALSGQNHNNKYIGLVLEHVSSPFGLDMMFHMDQEAKKAGYKLCIRFSYGDRENEVEEINFLCSLGVSGIIIMPCHGNHYNKTILKLVIDNFPIVLIDKKMSGIPVPSVRTASVDAVKNLVKHLHERGCKHIGLITTDVNGTTSLVERRKGFYNGIKELGLDEFEECVLQHYSNVLDSNPEPEYIESIKNYLIEMRDRLDGIVCTEFGIVSAFVEAAKEADIKIGEDLKACCIDEEYLAPTGFTFTHMKQDEKEIANQAINLMLSLIAGQKIDGEDFEIQAKFLIGKTS